MPRYIIERNIGDATEAEIQAAGERSMHAISQLDGVVWIRSYVSIAEGKLYCEYEAPSEEAVREHARLADIPADRISQIAFEVSPAMFR